MALRTRRSGLLLSCVQIGASGGAYDRRSVGQSMEAGKGTGWIDMRWHFVHELPGIRAGLTFKYLYSFKAVK